MEKKKTALKFTNRLQAALCLFSSRSQMASKFGDNKKVAHRPLSVSLMFLPQFVICDLFLNRCLTTKNLLVLYSKAREKC